MRLALVISQLGAGGAERVMSALANHWAEQGHEISLITLSSDTEDFYAISSNVRRLGLDLMGPSAGYLQAIWRNVVRLRSLRKSILGVRPDCVVSFTDKTNVLVLLAMSGSSVPVVVSERVDPRQYPIGRIWSCLRKLLYRRASGLVVQTEELRVWAESHVPGGRVHVVPNPVRNWPQNLSQGGDALECPVPAPYVLAMGRLTHQKGFDLLIEAFAEVVLRRGARGSWSLAILGEGEWRGKLDDLVSRVGLSGRVRLPGVVRDPERWLQHAGLFVLSSRYEGYPNALLEAMASGVACVSYACSTGPSEILSDGVDGRLVRPVGSVAQLADAMAELMDDPDARQRLALAARQTAEGFAIQRVGDRWLSVLSLAAGVDSRDRSRHGE
jgi:GalNAc-alpha-(1->4)-GalNAc-alpha-(1->3)-diNAcBac-PP-undecaprenol alpha-1,4-N-acetyl-D-galactosaminyltransferase